jgi:exopolysaccharide biosynthesis polyprenyl glycosylphosphotransferase
MQVLGDRYGTPGALANAMLDIYRDSSPERAQRLSRIGDGLLLGIASSVAAAEDGVFHWKIAMTLLAVVAALWLVASRALGQYSASNGRGFFGDIALTLVMFAGVIAPLAVLALIVPRIGATLHPGHVLAALLPTVLLWRVGTVGLPLWRARRGVDVLVVGIGPLGRLTGEEIREGHAPRQLLGYLRFADEMPHARLRAPVFGTIEELEGTLRERAVDEVYFASNANEHVAEVQAAIRVCETFGMPFALPACAYRLTRARLTSVSASADGYSHFLSLQVKPLQWFMKRFFDIVASAAALALLSPLLVAAIVLVKVTSRGPVLFRQERVGLHGRLFHMLKFRSMVANAEQLKARLLASNEQSGPVFKMKLDPRVTAFGRFMRKHSIDELPQLVNVLRGDMSIVGPRPPIPSEVTLYEAWQRRRLSVRPGLTCVWQVSGRNEISFRDWMLLDMRYIDHWSFAGDLGLIWKTVPVVLTGRGAS